MPEALRAQIDKSLAEIGEVDFRKRSHRGAGPTRSRVLPAEDLVHEKTETIRKGTGHRVNYRCSNPKCKEPIRNDKWDTHVLKACSDLRLQEPPEAALERSQNFAPDAEWDTKASRMQRIVTFMEQRHYLALAREYGEADLAKRITTANHFHVRLTNMIRSMDPTTKIILGHYAAHYQRDKPRGSTQGLADLILNIVWLRNSMSKEVVKMVEERRMPWLRVEKGRVSDESKRAIGEVFLALGGRIFLTRVEPMESRSYVPRRGYGELV